MSQEKESCYEIMSRVILSYEIMWNYVSSYDEKTAKCVWLLQIT